MKRLVLMVGLAGLVACDAGVSDPPRQPVAFTATVTGPAGAGIAAALLSVDATPDTVMVGGGWALTSSNADGSLVAAVLAVSQTTLTVELEVVAGTTPSMRVLQVAGPDNEIYADAVTFEVEIRERDGA